MELIFELRGFPARYYNNNKKTELSSLLLWYKWACFRINIAIFMYDKRLRRASSLAPKTNTFWLAKVTNEYSSSFMSIAAPHMQSVFMLPAHMSFPIGYTGAQLKMTFSLDNYTYYVDVLSNGKKKTVMGSVCNFAV